MDKAKDTPMTVKAISPVVRQSVRKLKLVTRAISGMSAQQALTVLPHLSSRAADPILKTIKQAVANATSTAGWSEQSLGAMGIGLCEGSTMKRFRIGGRGRIKPILKRTSRIVVTLRGGS